MAGLPDFAPPADNQFSVDVPSLRKFGFTTAHRPREPELYSSPLLIVPQSPGDIKTSAKSYLLHETVVFNQSYYGFSSHGDIDAPCISLLHLITHSELFRYHVLMTSARMGAERRTFLKENLERFPFPALNLFSVDQRQRAIELSKLLETSPDKPWQEINDFIFALFGLDTYDRQVVKDTLEVAPPYKEARDRANSVPAKIEREAFYAELHRLLAPSFAVTDETVTVHEVVAESSDILAPWYFFAISASNSPAVFSQATQKKLISQIAQAATETGCSRVIVHGDGTLLAGIIGQYRYWTLSRARLCALDIQRNHLDVFPVGRS